MPTYEYKCQKCGKTHEALQSMAAKPLTKCPRPRCGGRLKRLLGRGGTVLFRGPGFYITDYRSKGYREAKKKDEAPAASCQPTGSCSKPGGPSSS